MTRAFLPLLRAIDDRTLYAPSNNILDARLDGERTAARSPGGNLTLAKGDHMLVFTQANATARWIRLAAARKGRTDAQ